MASEYRFLTPPPHYTLIYVQEADPDICKNASNSFVAFVGIADIFGNANSDYQVFAATTFVANTAPLHVKQPTLPYPSRDT